MVRLVRVSEDSSDNHIGSALCYYILTENATVLSRTAVQHITNKDFETYEMRNV